MVVAKKIVLLGFVVEIIYEDKNGQQFMLSFPNKTNWTPGGDAVALCSNGGGSAAYFLPWKTAKKVPMPNGYKTEKKLFNKWHDYEHNRAYNLSITEKKLLHIGRVIRVQYFSDKFEAPSDPAGWHRYQHDYTRPPKFYQDKETNPLLWGINETGRKLVTANGLIG